MSAVSRTLSIVVAAIIALIPIYRAEGRGLSDTVIEDNRMLLNTVVTIRLYDTQDWDSLEKAFALIDSLEKILSRHHEGSDVSLLNQSAVGEAVPVSRETLEVIQTALHYAEISDGAFDPTIGPLVDLWGIGGDNPRLPEIMEIEAALETVNHRGILIDEAKQTVSFTEPGMSLDLGAIAKGWIAQQTVQYLKDAGQNHILVNLGGNISVSGGKPGGIPFRIGMQDPFNERGRYLGVFTVQGDVSVISSGIYERYFESGGIRYHHILDTATGYSVRNELTAVTILSHQAVDGDALSTTVFALGLDKGLDLVGKLEGVDAAFVTQDRRVILTPGAAERFEPINSNIETEVRTGG